MRVRKRERMGMEWNGMKRKEKIKELKITTGRNGEKENREKEE